MRRINFSKVKRLSTKILTAFVKNCSRLTTLVNLISMQKLARTTLGRRIQIPTGTLNTYSKKAQRDQPFRRLNLTVLLRPRPVLIRSSAKDPINLLLILMVYLTWYIRSSLVVLSFYLLSPAAFLRRICSSVLPSSKYYSTCQGPF